jgi:molybdopterin synthase catalytic subunit
MRVLVRYFAAVRERVGREEEWLDLPRGADVAAAMALLQRNHAGVAALAPYLRVARNQELCDLATPLEDQDELALLPPVAGGASPRVWLTAAPLALEPLLQAVAGPEMGAVTTFIGMVRRESAGRTVERLEYEAYAEMASRQLERIAQEVATQHGARVAIAHRVGVLAVGEPAVMIACAAPHRAEAFAACRDTIERLKREATIWKREIGPDGAVWVGLGP